MQKANKILSLLFTLMMLLTCLTIPTYAEAATKSTSPPKTTISSITSYPCGFNVYVKSQKKITGYQIQYSTNSKFKNAKSSKSTKTSFTVRNRASSTKYYVRVRTYKTSGKKTTYSAWSGNKSVTTLNKNASNPAHIKSVTAQHCGFKVQTYNSSNASGYQVRYSTKSNMSGSKTTNAVGKNSTTITVKNCSAKKKYYIQTRTYKTVKSKNYYSQWSPTKTITTQAHSYKTPVYTTKKIKVKDAWDEPIYETQQILVQEEYDEPIYDEVQAFYCSGCGIECVTESKKYGVNYSIFHMRHATPKKNDGIIPLCPEASNTETPYMTSGQTLGKPMTVKVQTGTVHHDAIYEDRKIQVGTKHHNAIYENKKTVTGYKCSCGATKKA